MWRVVVSNRKQQENFEHGNGPIKFGREPQPDGNLRLCVLADEYASANHLRVDPLPGDRMRLENLSKRKPVTIENDGSVVAVGATKEVSLPVRLCVGESLIEIEPVRAEEEELRLQTIEQPIRRSHGPQATPLWIGPGVAPSPKTLARWLETVVAVQRAAVGSHEFYEQTARAVVELVGLDAGLILLRRDDSWHIAAHYATARYTDRVTEFSRSILKRVTEERRTFFGCVEADPSMSLQNISAVVASPIFADDSERVAGVVYGWRFGASTSSETGIRPLEAQLVQVLAAAVGAGLARLRSEAEATRRLVQLEQFFSPDLARELDRDPSLLEGRERETTVLLSDVRGFSRLSERIGAPKTCQLMEDVMERLTACVRRYYGVVVDYFGDGLLAMWNAPTDQPDHAALACRAALAMLAELPGLNADWQAVVGKPLALGIGLNTGTAMVGNTGSRQKFKYGPLGLTVNLVSRVQGATKQLGVALLISGSTHAKLDGGFATRRLCRARVVGIAGPVDLHELHAETATPEWSTRRDSYEAALRLWESERFAEVPAALSPMLVGQAGDYDLPSLALLGRAVRCLTSPPEHFDPVLELSSK